MHRRQRPGSGQQATSRITSTLDALRSFNSASNPSVPLNPSPLSTQNGIPLDLLERLRSFPLFQSAPEAFLQNIAAALRPQLHSPRDYILTEGDQAKAMYWLVRGVVAVTSRDGESTYAELKPGAFFGEIGVLMNVPRTATITAQTRCLLVVLTKEALLKELPQFPDVGRAIRDEAEERLVLLRKQKAEEHNRILIPNASTHTSPRKRSLTEADPSNLFDAGGHWTSGSSIRSASVNVRNLLRELPFFDDLPPDILHFLGMNAQPMSYPPFTTIIQQHSFGREIYFMVKGEVEILNEGDLFTPGTSILHTNSVRLRPGQYFGEVAGLSLSPKRTASVRSVTHVECIVIGGEVLAEVWKKYSPSSREQVELTARNRLSSAQQANSRRKSSPLLDGKATTPTPLIDDLDLSDVLSSARRLSAAIDANVGMRNDLERNMIEPVDPDPYFPPDFDNLRAKSRRGSLVSVSLLSVLQEDPNHRQAVPLKTKHPATPPEHLSPVSKRPRTLSNIKSSGTRPILDDPVLLKIFSNLHLDELMKLRAVSSHWNRLLSTSATLMKHLDLSRYNTKITDDVICLSIVNFVGPRPESVDISNCFHVTDLGFGVLASTCGRNVRVWKMKSVWDITGQAILTMTEEAKHIEELDLSNCRKVSDALLARISGWIVPEGQRHTPHSNDGAGKQIARQLVQADAGQSRNQTGTNSPGTVIGCGSLKRLSLSYCKHISDRSMSHLAIHASKRLEYIDLTRCTTITDQGFQHWRHTRFPNLIYLCLADCTYLTDNAIVALADAAKNLQTLDLSFCCALSDTATEVLSLGCPHLTRLKLSFCGSAVSDSSLRSIGLHLLELQELSVRGCVRVTNVGVEAVVEGCHNLEFFDISQCKNLLRWIDQGGIERCRMSYKRNIVFETVAGHFIMREDP